MSTLDPPQSSRPKFDRRFCWTVERFRRASDAGVFREPSEWELVNGELWKKEQLSPPHAQTTELIAELFRSQFSARCRVREAKPVHLSEDTELTPDISVVESRGPEYGKRHPSPDDILLLVAVADTSRSRQMMIKPEVYAHAGIADYWVYLISTRELIVHRRPSFDGYLEIMRLTDSDVISPIAAPDIEFAVRELIVCAGSDKDKIE